MAILSIPSINFEERKPEVIRQFFNERGIFFDQWDASVEFSDKATQEEILSAYESQLSPFMKRGGYETADVISINHLTENYDAIRAKFYRSTHILKMKYAISLMVRDYFGSI